MNNRTAPLIARTARRLEVLAAEALAIHRTTANPFKAFGYWGRYARLTARAERL